MSSAPRSNPALEASFSVVGGDDKPLNVSAFTAQSIRVHNPGSFFVVFPNVPGGVVAPYTTGATIGLPPPGINSVHVVTVTPPGYANDTQGLGETATVILSEAYLPSSPGAPLPANPRPSVLWSALTRLGNWGSATAQPLNFAIGALTPAVALFVFGPAGSSFTLHATGHTTGFDYASQTGVGASQASIKSALLTVPIAAAGAPSDTSLDFTWTDSGGLTYVLFAIAPSGLPPGQSTMANSEPVAIASDQQALVDTYDLQGENRPAAGTTASIVFSGVAGKKITLDFAKWVILTGTTALAGQFATVLDGASEIYADVVNAAASTLQQLPHLGPRAGFVGTAGNSMTVKFPTNVAGSNEIVVAGAYQR